MAMCEPDLRLSPPRVKAGGPSPLRGCIRLIPHEDGNESPGLSPRIRGPSGARALLQDEPFLAQSPTVSGAIDHMARSPFHQGSPLAPSADPNAATASAFGSPLHQSSRPQPVAVADHGKMWPDILPAGPVRHASPSRVNTTRPPAINTTPVPEVASPAFLVSSAAGTPVGTRGNTPVGSPMRGGGHQHPAPFAQPHGPGATRFSNLNSNAPVAGSLEGQLQHMEQTADAIKQQFDRLTCHRPPTPLGGQQEVDYTVRHLSPTRRPSRFHATSHEREDSVRGVSADGSGGLVYVPPSSLVPSSGPALVSQKSMPNMSKFPLARAGAEGGTAAMVPQQALGVAAARINGQDALSSFMYEYMPPS